MTIRVAIVGTCASGKTSVSSALSDRGFVAYSVSQEHSGVPELWRHLKPDYVIYLSNTLGTLRRRRGIDTWPAWIYEAQLKRLASARDHAYAIVETDYVDLEAVVQTIIDLLDQSLPTETSR